MASPAVKFKYLGSIIGENINDRIFEYASVSDLLRLFALIIQKQLLCT